MQRLAPWQRIVVAMARGITLAPSGQMKWMANVFVDSVETGEMFSVFPVEADSIHDAARAIAKMAARRLYFPDGEASFVNQIEEQLFRANIGIYQGGGVTKGRSITMLISEYRGVQ